MVRHKGFFRQDCKWDREAQAYIALGPREFVPLNKWVGAGGSLQDDLQKAQVFGWSKRATADLDRMRERPEEYEVIPVELVLRR